MARQDLGHELTSGEITDLWMSVLPAVSAYVRAEVKNSHDAEDVMQEIGKAILSSAGRYDPSRPFVRWAFGVARNQILRYHRQRSIDRVVFSSEFVEGLAATYELVLPQHPRRREALEECLKGLKSKQRQAVELYYKHELPQLDIAKRMGMTKSAVGVLMHRTRRMLSDCIRRRLSTETT